MCKVPSLALATSPWSRCSPRRNPARSFLARRMLVRLESTCMQGVCRGEWARSQEPKAATWPLARGPRLTRIGTSHSLGQHGFAHATPRTSRWLADRHRPPGRRLHLLRRHAAVAATRADSVPPHAAVRRDHLVVLPRHPDDRPDVRGAERVAKEIGSPLKFGIA